MISNIPQIVVKRHSCHSRLSNFLYIVGSVCAISLVFFLQSCGASIKDEARREGLRIGFSLDSLVVERWQRDVEEFKLAVDDLGASVVLKVADQNATKQQMQIREMLRTGIDALVIVPNDADALSDTIREVKRAGIPVLSYDRLVRNGNVDIYVSFDNIKIGQLMAESLISAVPTGRYVILNGAKTDNNAQLLNKGVFSVLQPFINSGQIRVIAELWPNSWDSDEVRAGFEKILDNEGKVDAVIAGNDMLAEVAIAALSERRLAGKTKVVGQDGDLAACQRIAEGTQLATVYKPVNRLALTAAGFAVMLARRDPVILAGRIDDGAFQVPYVSLEPVLVNKTNLLDTVIADGFHEKDAVFRNLRSTDDN